MRHGSENLALCCQEIQSLVGGLNLIFVHITLCYLMSEKCNQAQFRTLFVLSFIYPDMF